MPDKALAQRMKSLKASGNNEATGQVWKKLAESKKSLTYRLVSRLLNQLAPGCGLDAKELTQNVLSEFYENIEEYNPKYAFNTWIGAIAKKHIMRERRRLWKELVTDPEELHGKVHYIEKHESRADAIKLLQKLVQYFKNKGKPQHYEVLYYYKFVRATFTDIAFAIKLVDDSSDKDSIRNASERVRIWLKQAEEIAEQFRQEYEHEFPEEYLE